MICQNPSTQIHVSPWAKIRMAWCRGAGGCRLQDVVQGSMQWVLASNFMVDMTWLLSACPDLLQAQQLVLVHGEHTPDRYAPGFLPNLLLCCDRS